MGASGWCYFVPHQDDVGAALQALRQETFRREYGGGNGAPIVLATAKTRPRSIADAVRQAGENGTHSILDVDRVIDLDELRRMEEDAAAIEKALTGGGDPARLHAAMLGHLAARGSGRAGGVISPLQPEEYDAIFGTRTPTRADVEAHERDLQPLRGRWCGVFVVVYQDGMKHELCFIGYSGD